MAISGECAYQNADGRMQICWIDSGQARMKYEVTANNWSSDMDLGVHGYVLDGSKPTAMSRNQEGRLVFVAVSSLGVRVAISQVAMNSGWGSWAPLV